MLNESRNLSKKCSLTSTIKVKTMEEKFRRNISNMKYFFLLDADGHNLMYCQHSFKTRSLKI
jgi:hypothetical protein